MSVKGLPRPNQFRNDMAALFLNSAFTKTEALEEAKERTNNIFLMAGNMMGYKYAEMIGGI